MVVLAVGYGMNADEVSASICRSGIVTADAIVKLFNSTVMAKLLIVGGMCGVATNRNSFMIDGSRNLMFMADSYMIPYVSSKIRAKCKTLHLSLILIRVLSILLLFGKGNACMDCR